MSLETVQQVDKMKGLLQDFCRSRCWRRELHGPDAEAPTLPHLEKGVLSELEMVEQG